jgi:serine/threonine-protein kinase
VLKEEYLGEPTLTTIPQAEYYNSRAIAINSSLAAIHTSRAFILTKLWRWTEAEQEFNKSIEIDPKNAKTRQWYSLFLRIMGRYDESLKQIKIGHDIDPSDKLVRVNIVIAYLAKGESDNAVEEGKELWRLAPDFWGGRAWLGMARLGLSPVPKADALTDLEAGVDHSKNSHTLRGNLGFAYAFLGETSKAEEQLNQLEELYNQHKATGQDLAKIYAGLGRKDDAFEWLEKDYKIRSGDLPHISWHPAFSSLHGDPRFEDLLRRMGIAPEQSRSTVAQRSTPRREPS